MNTSETYSEKDKMKTVDFEELKRRDEKLPKASPLLNANHLYLYCYFNPYISIHQRKLPIGFYQTAKDIETIIRETFPLTIAGADASIPIPERSPGNISRYCGLIRAISKSGVEADILIKAYHIANSGGRTIDYEPAFLNMKAHFPVNNRYLENTKNALTRLWPMIRGIEFASPKVPKGGKRENFQPGSILLVRDGKAIATGYPCFRELGLLLEEKDISLIGGQGM